MDQAKALVACVQFDPKILQKDRNLNSILRYVGEASSKGARLVVFPECCLQGYIFESWSEAREYSEPVPGPATDAVSEIAREKGVYVVLGMIEREDENLYNDAVLVGPHGERGGVVGKYRKMHPWWPIEHNWATEGNLGYNVFGTDIGNIGLMICYDAWYPEVARCLAIKGADIICHPSNWTEEKGFDAPDFFAKGRALENHVYFLGCDRVGTERGTAWAGFTQIIDPFGTVLAKANPGQEETIYAEIDSRTARNKSVVQADARSDLWWARRPETYRAIVD